jgi:hypothetical protein
VLIHLLQPAATRALTLAASVPWQSHWRLLCLLSAGYLQLLAVVNSTATPPVGALATRDSIVASLCDTSSAMADSHADEKVVYALLSAVETNMNRLRRSIDGLRQIHNRWKDNNGISINLIAQLTALKSNLGNMHDWMSHALSDMHPQLLADLDLLMTSCGLLVQHLDVLVPRLQQPDHVPLDYASKLKYAVGGKSMERLRKVAQGQNEAVTLLLAACKWCALCSPAINFTRSNHIQSCHGTAQDFTSQVSPDPLA